MTTARAMTVATAFLIAGGALAWWLSSTTPAVDDSGTPAVPERAPARPAAGVVSTPARAAIADATGLQPVRVRVVRATAQRTAQPIAGARVFLCDSHWQDGAASPSHVEHETDADGRADFGVVTNNYDDVIVAAPHHAPVCDRRAAGASEHTVTLPPALSLAGTVRLDGQAPAPPIELRLTGFRDPSVDWCAAAHAALRGLELSDSRMRVTTGSDGAFVVFGLPAGDTVTIAGPESLRRVTTDTDQAPQITAVTPALGLVLDLRTPWALTGRVVTEPKPAVPVTPSASPALAFVGKMWVPPADLAVQVSFRRSGGRMRVARQDVVAGQRFAVPFDEVDITSVLLQVCEGDGLGDAVLLQREFTAPEIAVPLRGSCDVGDLLIRDTPRDIHIKVVDRGGAPLPGARVAVSARRVSEPANAQGEVSLSVPRAVTTLVVGAFGCASLRLTIPEPLPPLWLVTLDSTNQLRLVLTPAPGAPPPRGLRVAIEHPGFPDDAPERFGTFASVRGPLAGGGEWTQHDAGFGPSFGARKHIYDVPEDGVLTWSDFRAGEEFTLTVSDRWHQEVSAHRLRLQAGEHRELRCDLPPPRTVSGRVVNASGQPIPGAAVAFVAAWLLDPVVTDADGAFSLTDIYGTGIALSISAPGHASLSVADAELRQHRQFVLEGARSIWVEVVDSAGARIDAEVAIELEGTSAPSAVRRGIGLFQVEDLPPRRGVVRASSGPRHGEAVLGPTQGDLRIIVQ